jgi:hypothetical protein
MMKNNKISSDKIRRTFLAKKIDEIKMILGTNIDFIVEQMQPIISGSTNEGWQTIMVRCPIFD